MPDVDEVVDGEESAQDEGCLAERAAAVGLVARARAQEHLEACFFAHLGVVVSSTDPRWGAVVHYMQLIYLGLGAGGDGRIGRREVEDGIIIAIFLCWTARGGCVTLLSIGIWHGWAWHIGDRLVFVPTQQLPRRSFTFTAPPRYGNFQWHSLLRTYTELSFGLGWVGDAPKRGVGNGDMIPGPLPAGHAP